LKQYSVERSTVGRPLGRPKPMERRVPGDVRTDGINHFLESNGVSVAVAYVVSKHGAFAASVTSVYIRNVLPTSTSRLARCS
jgi:hypothetical protein